MTELFRHFAMILFTRNFAYAKFRDNKTLAKISELTVGFGFYSSFYIENLIVLMLS